MKLICTVLFLSIFIMPISAHEVSKGILITKTSKKSNLKFIKHKLDAIDVKMFIRKYKGEYFIYSGKYSDDFVLKNKFKSIKRYFASAVINDARTVTESNIKGNGSQQKSNIMFVNLAYALTNINGSTDNQKLSEMKNSGGGYLLEGGYILNKNIFTSLAYLNTSTSDIKTTNIYLSINYQLNPMRDLGLYLGLLSGYSSLILSSDASSASTSMLIGTQAGVKYNLSKNIALFSAYQVLSLNHTIKNLDDGTKLKFTLIQNIQLGLQFSF